jgi:hypothetical protein
MLGVGPHHQHQLLYDAVIHHSQCHNNQKAIETFSLM